MGGKGKGLDTWEGCKSFEPLGLVTLEEGTLILKLGPGPGSQSPELGTGRRRLSKRHRFSSRLRIQFSRALSLSVACLRNLRVAEVNPER